MKKELKFEKIEKIVKAALAFRFVFTGITVAKAVYDMIPKQDKITGIDTDALIEKHLPKQDEVYPA